jgi:hypothetical protein
MLDRPSASLERSWVDQAQLRFDAGNDALVLKTRALLNRVVGDDSLHPRLINTLSLLEHIGSHKIMATQHGAEVDQATLRHLAEECHHAFFMKRQAEKTAGRPLDYTPADLLAPEAARMYFQRLEAGMLRRLASQGSAGAVYLYMSMIVEFRAVWFYSLYQQTLQRHEHAMSLKRLLGEEQNHLTDMAARLEHAGELSDARVDAFVHAEHVLYGRFLDQLQQSVN